VLNAIECADGQHDQTASLPRVRLAKFGKDDQMSNAALSTVRHEATEVIEDKQNVKKNSL
jgi:hypothetical protein